MLALVLTHQIDALMVSASAAWKTPVLTHQTDALKVSASAAWGTPVPTGNFV